MLTNNLTIIVVEDSLWILEVWKLQTKALKNVTLHCYPGPAELKADFAKVSTYRDCVYVLDYFFDDERSIRGPDLADWLRTAGVTAPIYLASDVTHLDANESASFTGRLSKDPTQAIAALASLLQKHSQP